jgi:hypothetical protein
MEKTDAAPPSDILALHVYEQTRRAYPDLNAAAVFAYHSAFSAVPWAY